MIQKTLHIKFSTKNEKLADEIKQILESNLFDADFDVEMFAVKMKKSRAQLYRIVKELTGKSPSGFIKHQRIKMACKLLNEKGCIIKKVSDAVGFKDSSYFTKCFKSIMKMTPGDYQKMKQA